MALANRIDDGFRTTIEFSEFPTLEFYEISITLPGVDGGTPIETTNMRSDELRTFWLRQLKTLTPVTIVAGYTADIYDPAATYAMVNVNQEVTITGPNGFEISFWGGVVSVQPGPMEEGQRPTISITVQPTNTDNDKVEQQYTYTPPA